MKPECVLSFSGGMDSATLMVYCMKMFGKGRPEAIYPVNFIYGSKHNRWEREAARRFCAYYGLDLTEIDLSNVGAHLKSDLLLSGGAIPEGHYEDENMKRTVVPGRNMIFLAILAGIAESLGAPRVAIGIHSGDHTIYPDCRPEFFKAFAAAMAAGTGGKVEMVAPFIKEDKTSILRSGFRWDVPYHLTRTCYKDQKFSCGQCGACQERLEAFRHHGRRDPIKYEGGE